VKCEKSVFDHVDDNEWTCADPEHAGALKRREEGRQGQWSALITRRQSGGLRHYLAGEPISCGSSIELQDLKWFADDFGEFRQYLGQGRVVRYEALQDGKTIRATLHTVVGGHEFVATVEAWMRFRWPVKGGA